MFQLCSDKSLKSARWLKFHGEGPLCCSKSIFNGICNFRERDLKFMSTQDVSWLKLRRLFIENYAEKLEVLSFFIGRIMFFDNTYILNCVIKVTKFRITLESLQPENISSLLNFS